MSATIQKDIQQFYVAGINHKKATASVRSLFAVNHEKYTQLIAAAPAKNIHELFVLSTCNRTEIYGFAQTACDLMQLLCTVTEGNLALFEEIAYVKQGMDAVNHFFEVGAGLDSQILGDYEIIGQIKNAARFAKQHMALGAFTERLVNSVIEVSKLVKNKTDLSAGTVSVSYAAIQWLTKTVKDIRHKKILLFGVGKIGRSTCKNLIEYLQPSQITLINRTDETAAKFAEENQLHFAPYQNLPEQINEADIILVATNSPSPTILPEHIQDGKAKIIIDLSIPENVHPDMAALPDIKVINVDGLSKLKDETLQRREKEVPKAKEIISEYMLEFTEWYKMRKHAATLHAVKIRLQEIHSKEIYSQKKGPDFRLEDIEQVSSRIIQKVINMMACKVRADQENSEQYIDAINELFETGIK